MAAPLALASKARARSEGATVADVNKDGKMDILTGEVWYEAPDWKMHEIRKPAADYRPERSVKDR